MKKLFALAIVAGMVAFVACGPSKKEIEAKEKAKQDSVNAAERARREADSLANVERERRHLDSLRQDSMAKADKKKPQQPQPQPQQKKSVQQIKQEIKKGRG